jgi:hypothetical protein
MGARSSRSRVAKSVVAQKEKTFVGSIDYSSFRVQGSGFPVGIESSLPEFKGFRPKKLSASGTLNDEL